jgi:quinol monooxygenase YgiN
MSNLQTTGVFKIHAGKLNDFKALASTAMAIVKEKEKATTLQYDWFFNEDFSQCVVRETYADSNAVFTHMGNVGELLGKLLQISDLSLEVFGDPTAELTKALSDMKAKLYSPYKG